MPHVCNVLRMTDIERHITLVASIVALATLLLSMLIGVSNSGASHRRTTATIATPQGPLVVETTGYSAREAATLTAFLRQDVLTSQPHLLATPPEVVTHYDPGGIVERGEWHFPSDG